VENYSVEGLRCLFVGAANIREKDYLRWHEEYEKASTDLKEIEKKQRGERNKIEELENELEQNLYLLGKEENDDSYSKG
jgi:hypothetical protein